MSRILTDTRNLQFVLDGNVGTKGGNERTDVALVQYALLRLSVSDMGVPNVTIGMGKMIKVDGYYGPQTASYITAYQESRKSVLNPAMNGYLQPCGNFGKNSTPTTWSFGILQRDLEGKRGALAALMRQDSLCPEFLKSCFFTR